MEILVNRCYGGFRISDFGLFKLRENNIMDDADGFEIRTNSKFIKLFERYGDKLFDKCSHVEIEELPDNTTDWDIQEIDGYEIVIYVLDGKINYL
jgi:hypothetical protein